MCWAIIVYFVNHCVLSYFCFIAKKKDLESTSTSKRPRFVNTHGPVEPQEHFIVPFEQLDSYQNLILAVERRQCPLFVGHFQSGKTSTLRYLSENNLNWFHISSAKLGSEWNECLATIC